jgi:hypothetical protein
MNVTDENQRQCNPKGNVSFPLRFDSGITSNVPINDPKFMMTFTKRASNKLNPKFEDESRTTGGLLDESFTSLKIVYNNYNYSLLTTQICLSTHPIIMNDLKEKNKIDYILTLESEKDQFNKHIAPVAFIIIVIPLIITPNDEIKADNLYLGSILNNDLQGDYSIESIFAGLKKYIWYETCLEPHGDTALAYISNEGVKISENLYWNLLATWRKDSPFDIKKALTSATTKIKSEIKDFCETTSSTDDVNVLGNSINSLQASVYVPKLNRRIETWPSYTPPYDIVLNVESNPVVLSSMSSMKEGFQVSRTPAITGVFATETGGTTIPIAFPTGTPESESEILADLERISRMSVDGKTINLGEFKCVPLDMDGAIDASGVHFDRMGMPLTNLFKERNDLREYTKVNKVSLDKLETYFGVGIGILIAIILIIFLVIPWVRKTFFSAVITPTTLLPNKTGEIGFYIIMAFIMAGAGFMVGAAVTSI